MNHFYKFLATLVFLVGLVPSSQAQCPNDNSLYDILPAPTTIGASVGNDDCIFGGQYYRVTNMIAGNTYRLSTCGVGTTFDTKLTVYAQSGGAALAFNDDFCDLASEIIFTPTVTGNYHILVDEWGPFDGCLDNEDCAELVITLISTPGGGGEYCTPLYSTGTDFGDFIDGVQLGSINNQNSGIAEGPSFTYFNSLSTDLNQSANYTLTVTNNPDFTEIVAAWIDYNQNTIFDSSELLGEISIPAGESGTINFTVPANALAGNTRLRVRMAWNTTNIDPCSSYSFGETEDYNINILTSTPPPPTVPSCVTDVSPLNGAQGVSTSASITWTAGLGSPTFYQIYFGTDASPELVEANFTSTTYTPASLIANTTYYFQIVPGNAEGLADGCLVFSFNTNETVSNSFNMTDGSVTACSGDFFDSGGATSNYSNNEFFVFTISPDQPNSVVQVTFNSFSTELDFDELFVFDGDDLDAVIIGNPLSGSITTPITFTGTTPSGALTFVFLSDGSVNDAGWSASINCISTVALPECATNSQPANSATGVVINPTITWNAPTSVVTGYDVYFGTNATPPLVQSGVTGTSYTPTTLLPNTTYYYQIVSLNENGAAENCQIVSFTTGETLNVLMQNGTVTTCSANFFDTGGASGNYSNNENLTLTINPSDINSKVQVIFNSFATENGFDFLRIYDGNSITAPQIGPLAGFTGINSPGTIVSTATDGSLTFVFTSDNSVNAAGWNAVVGCLSALELPDCATISGGPANGASDVCLNGNTFTWTAPASVVTGYEVYFGTPTAELVSTQTGTSYALPLLQPNTAYEFYVLSVNDNGVSENCDIQSFLTGDCVNYCEASGTLANCGGTSEFIANVQIGSINNPSLCSGYTDFTAISTNLVAGSSNPITVTNGSSSWPTDQCAIYVDWNSDGDFDDVGETITPIVGSPGVGPYTASIIVPADATGAKRMRVRINFGAALACGITSFGEVEDYTLNIVPATTGTPECVTYLAPANNATEVAISGVVLTWEASATGGTPSSYDVYFGTDANPVLVASGVQGTTYNVGTLTTNTTYFWQVIAINDDGVADDCGINTFTTTATADIVMQNGTFTTCNANFYDSGGLNGNYQNNENFTLTIFPDSPDGFVQVVFNTFQIENGFERLRVYNGNSTAAPQIGPALGYTNNVSPGTVLSSAPDGSLTFVFTSDGSVAQAGWSASVTCQFANDVPECATNLVPTDGAVEVQAATILSWTPGNGIATGYDVYFGTEPNPPLVASNVSGTSYNPGVLDLNTTYFWYVVPVNAIGPAEGCAEQSFTTTDVLNINMQNGTFTTCSGNFFDSGGPDGNYQNSENFTITFFPSTPNSAVQIQFNTFQIENGFERLRVYNGNSTAAPQIGPALGYTNNVSPGTVVSSAPDGSLTFVFTSDGSVAQAGWSAAISCVSTLDLPVCASNLVPADFATNISGAGTTLSWSTGGGIVTGYDVYFGTDPFDLPLVSANQIGTTYITGPLALSTDYYWLVVPVNSNGPADACVVQTFTTEESLNINMQNGTFTTCNANFFDSGGPNGNYQNSENFTLTIFPDSPGGFVQVVFNSFQIENGFERLRVYNGNSTAAPQIGPALGYTNNVSPGTVLSSAPDGSLTFVFTSDGSVAQAGWDATVTCQFANDVPECATNLIPAADAVEVSASTSLSWTPGAGIATGYDVYFGTTPNPPLVAANVVGTSYNPGVLSLNTTYYWYVIPTNSQGPAEGCVEQSFTTTSELNINMQNGSFTTCGANFFDSGGATGNYQNNENFTITFFPSIPGQNVQVVFNTFQIENGFDRLRVYDGNSIAAPQIGPALGYTNNVSPGTVLSSAPDGSLTFVFTSDGSVAQAGWSAIVSCFDPNQVPNCVNITSGPADGSSNTCTNQALFTWTNGGGLVDAYEVYFGTTTLELVASQTETTYNPGVLLPNTTYQFQVIPVNAQGPSVDCPIITFTTQACVIYCDASGTLANCVGNNEFIANVQIGSIDNPSACSGYTDYTSISTPVAIGLSYPITVTNGSVSWPTDQCGIWVDWNQDGDFLDAGEAITPVAGSPGVGPYTASINVPVGALTGPTRMRVRINFGAVAPCGITTFGEVEDYTLIVLEPTAGAPSCAINLTPASGAVNVSNSVVLTWSPDINNGGTPTGYDVYFGTDANPPLVSANQPASSYNPGLLIPNTTYYWYVTPINNDGVAQDCEVFSFTTTGTINVNMQNGTIITCSANFFDSAGPNANYANNENFTLTFTPSVPGNFIQVVFNSFNTENNFDFLRIYNGNSIAAPQIGPAAGYTGANSPGIVTSTAPDGSLTFVFTSDFIITAAGWNAIVACLDPTSAPGCPVITAGPANGATDVCTDDVVFTWTNPAGSIVDGYFVFFGTEGNTEFVDFAEGNNLYAPGALLQNTTYQLVLVPQNANGQNISCDTITFTTGTCTQIGCVGIPPGSILEGENCGDNINGGCNSTPSAFGSLACGETLYGSTFNDGATRDTDWFNFTVTDAGVYSVSVNAEFLGTLFFADATNCTNTVIIDQVDFIGCDTVTLTAFFNPGVYTAIVVPSFTGPQINCTSGLNNYTISLNSASGQASIAPVAPVCITTAPFNLFAVPAGGTWSGTGITNTANGTFDPSVAGIGSFVITYTAPGGCNSTDQVTIEVGAGGIAPNTPTGPATVCAGETSSSVTVDPIFGSSSYVWVLTPTSAGTITGNTETATVNWNPSFVGTASIVVATQSACGLSPFSQSLDVVVGATPAAPGAIQGSPTVCVISSVYTTDGSVGADSYTWTISPTEAGSIIGNGTNATVNWNVSFTGPVSISITATNACGTSSATTLNVTKLPNPFADFVGLDSTYCASDAPFELTGIPSGGTFAITTSAGAAASGIFGNIFNPNAAGAGIFNISYTIQIGECIGQRVQEVTVLSAPSVSIEALPSNVCSQSDNITLVGSPVGGVFSGTGVSAGVFNPGLAGAGVHTITYTVAGSGGGCDGVATVSVTVNPSPNVAISTIPSPLCVNSNPVLIVGTPAPGVSFVNGTAASTVDPAALGVGTHVVRYEVDNGVCVGFAEQTITVTEALSASINNLPATMCSNDTPVILSSTPSGGIFSGPGIQGNIFDPKLAGPGIHVITCVVTQGACTAVVTQSIVVNPSPVAYFTYSTNGSTIVLNNISQNATSYSWNFGDGNTSTLENPTHAYASNGSYVITLTANSTSCGTSTFNLPLELSVGIGEIAGFEDVKLFPNPTLGLISLHFSSNRNQTFAVRITDAAGRLIEQDAITNYSGNFNKTYDLTSLARGMYFFTIVSDNGTINYRVVKQ